MQVRRTGREGNPPVAHAGVGAAESLGGAGDAGDGEPTADGVRHHWQVSKPGLVGELDILVLHACVMIKLGDRGAADMDGEM
eukprot:6723860-Pyramimonas_sp.AAC.1